MMRQAIERCFAAPEVTAIVIDPLASNIAAHRFYRRLGFEEKGHRRFGEDDCLVHRLDRQNWLTVQNYRRSALPVGAAGRQRPLLRRSYP